MTVNNSDLNELLEKAITAGKPKVPWYRRWWDQLIYNLKVTLRLLLVILVVVSLAQFISEHPVIFMAMVAALG